MSLSATTSARGEVPEHPPAELLYKHRVSVRRSLRAVWEARELVVTVAERDFLVRYKQAYLGVGWAVLTPVLMMLVFSGVRQVGGFSIDTGGVPYPLFAYVGLLPWTFFSSSLSRGGASLISNKALLNKVHCPREVFPFASVLVSLLDMLIAVSVLAVLFVVTGYAPRATSVWVPVLLVVQIGFALAVAMILSVVVVYLRDVQQLMPQLLQLGLFATPVVYNIDPASPVLRVLLAAINPLAPVITSYRRTVLFGQPPEWGLLGVGALSTTVLLTVGFVFFKKAETGIADVA